MSVCVPIYSKTVKVPLMIFQQFSDHQKTVPYKEVVEICHSDSSGEKEVEEEVLSTHLEVKKHQMKVAMELVCLNVHFVALCIATSKTDPF